MEMMMNRRKSRGGKANRGHRDRRVPAVKPIPLPQIDVFFICECIL